MHWQSARLSLSAKSLQQEHGRDSRGRGAVWYSYDTALLSICLSFSLSLALPLISDWTTLFLKNACNSGQMVPLVYFGRTRVLALSSACFWVRRCFWKRIEWVKSGCEWPVLRWKVFFHFFRCSWPLHIAWFEGNKSNLLGFSLSSPSTFPFVLNMQIWQTVTTHSPANAPHNPTNCHPIREDYMKEL